MRVGHLDREAGSSLSSDLCIDDVLRNRRDSLGLAVNRPVRSEFVQRYESVLSACIRPRQFISRFRRGFAVIGFQTSVGISLARFLRIREPQDARRGSMKPNRGERLAAHWTQKPADQIVREVEHDNSETTNCGQKKYPKSTDCLEGDVTPTAFSGATRRSPSQEAWDRWSRQLLPRRRPP